MERVRALTDHHGWIASVPPFIARLIDFQLLKPNVNFPVLSNLLEFVGACIRNQLDPFCNTLLFFQDCVAFRFRFKLERFILLNLRSRFGNGDLLF